MLEPKELESPTRVVEAKQETEELDQEALKDVLGLILASFEGLNNRESLKQVTGLRDQKVLGC
jgi:hypothetical protein